LEPLQTLSSNVMGTAHVLEALRSTPSVKAAVVITSDKVYDNVEWVWAYRESDRLGSSEPYGASKACAELVVDAYRRSYFHDDDRIPTTATARAGNVIGGGDWAKDRLIPDCVRALRKNETIEIHHPDATRPWQYVLEPLGAYLHLGRQLGGPRGAEFCKSWNFGPNNSANKNVGEVVGDVIRLWGSGNLKVGHDPKAPHEDH
jgi:CDP-glucose 4,6-dehydratase